MTSFQVNFAAPRQGNFYAVCLGDDGQRINPNTGQLSSSISHSASSVSLSLTKFPIYSSTVSAARLGKVRINTCIYERLGSTPAADDLMVAHEEGVWDPETGILIRSSDPLQASARVFASLPENRIDTFAIVGTRTGQANVFVDKALGSVVAKVSVSSYGGTVTGVSLRVVGQGLKTGIIVQKVPFSAPYASLKFTLASNEFKNAANSGMYALCLESAGGNVIGLGSPTPGVTLAQAGNPGKVEVTTSTMPSRDLRKF